MPALRRPIHIALSSGDFTKLVKPAATTARSNAWSEPQAVLPYLIAGFATGAFGATLALMLRPGIVFACMLLSCWLAFLSQAFRASEHV